MTLWSVSLFCDPDPTLTTCADPGMPQFGIQNSSQGYQVMGSAEIGPRASGLLPLPVTVNLGGPGDLAWNSTSGGRDLGSWRRKGLCLLELSSRDPCHSCTCYQETGKTVV